MRKMEMAPIIIPTLNRYEHLKRCIDSLKKNGFVSRTDLFISLDYPPNSNYYDGYIKTKEYLENTNFDTFRNVCIYWQEHNLGSEKNIDFLLSIVYERYDYFIISEDDNEFAPNYLEYVNKGLELFKDDEDIVGICCIGYPTVKPLKNNVGTLSMLAAWGFGTWKCKFKKMSEWINRNNFMRVLRDGEICKRLYKTAPKYYTCLVNALMSDPESDSDVYVASGGEIRTIDYTMGVYMNVFNYKAIYPVVPKVRNWGYDGSGEHCGVAEEYNGKNFPLDVAVSFDYIIDQPLEHFSIHSSVATLKKARRARRYRRLIIISKIKFARKIHNLFYILDRIIHGFVLNGE